MDPGVVLTLDPDSVASLALHYSCPGDVAVMIVAPEMFQIDMHLLFYSILQIHKHTLVEINVNMFIHNVYCKLQSSIILKRVALPRLNGPSH